MTDEQIASDLREWLKEMRGALQEAREYGLLVEFVNADLPNAGWARSVLAADDTTLEITRTVKL